MWPSWPVTAVLFALPAALLASPLCPAPCTDDPSKWTPYSSLSNLKDCNHPVLLDFSSHELANTVKDAANVSFKILACTVDDSPDTPFASFYTVPGQGEGGQTEDDASRLRPFDFFLNLLQTVVNQTANRDTFSVLGRLNSVWVGIYRGDAVNDTLALSAIDRIRHEWHARPLPRAGIQLCGGDRDADHTFGIAFDPTGDTVFVEQAIGSWTKGECLESEEAFDLVDSAAVKEPTRESLSAKSVNSANATIAGFSTQLNCNTITVKPGDTCTRLADRCNITGAEFMKYNPQKGLCSWLRPGEEVCCSSKKSTKPDPIMNKDGSCATYMTQEDDTCASIAQDFMIEESQIQFYNDGRTWGWSGCDNIHGGMNICLSQGIPPLPAPRTGAVCGPTVPGTEMPTDGAPLANLNPCPLNACCNTLGECGATPEYCVYEEGPTGNPGTAPQGKKGCISNCGMDIVDNSPPPGEFMRIGYYESFNLDRPCLNLLAAHINVNDYSHIHWGFASVSRDFRISINDTHNQWLDFLALQGVKRIVSFGGWGYTVNGAAYDVLREAMLPENVDRFIVSVLEFIADNNLDGVDFDWEYPGASDPQDVSLDIPQDQRADGPNYLAFVKKLRKIFPPGKSISVAAPATYWHLQAFPIAEMWEHVDYLIYMTYDFHGQWDYETSVIQDWCKGGNCLRSHVNLTETEWALSMITKAGVPRNAITIGVASYGRAFGMVDPDCTKPECRFTGPRTAAIPGMCTRTPGLLAIAEIEALMIEGDINESYYDAASDSNVLVYNETQWVGFMSKSTMRRRVERYRRMNFAGFANWAVDLTHWSGDDVETEEASLWGLPKNGTAT
ncbi:uncharacterized protein DSM5745_07151 [Aspergillus mulundensis]|uniref:chitinase n=1 Tax=Aspergillus mulundensis TaxID=1810919 RepID=A0A3D8RKB4_9EURO|nr:Uncharacterized protein DSM5745_07151 [Aspergillus mulundensis]RDW74489.1 Uncharacterized protein DSM5745_07151 [Aspergillus mulundensis]